MNVGDLFERLSFGEFNDHTIGMEGEGDIDPNHQSKVISHANNALTELFSKFTHNKDYVKLRLLEGLQRYRITAANALSVDPVNGFIMDTEQEPYTDNLIKILGIKVLDDPETIVNEGMGLSLNRRDIEDTTMRIKTLNYRTLFIEDPVPGRVIEIEYQAKHPKLVTPADLSQEIDIHPVLETALEAHIAYQSFGSMNGEAHLAKSRILWGRYQQICERVDLEDLLQETDNSDYDRLHQKGFK